MQVHRNTTVHVVPAHMVTLMHNEILVFLDFDGVLRPLNSPPDKFDTSCLAHFEAVVKSLPQTKIVISSTWRLAYSLSAMKARFSREVSERIIGVTPETQDLSEPQRHREVITFLHQTTRRNAKWIAVDDCRENFPAGIDIIVTNGQLGFSVDDARALQAMVKKLGGNS